MGMRFFWWGQKSIWTRIWKFRFFGRNRLGIIFLGTFVPQLRSLGGPRHFLEKSVFDIFFQLFFFCLPAYLPAYLPTCLPTTYLVPAYLLPPSLPVSLLPTYLPTTYLPTYHYAAPTEYPLKTIYDAFYIFLISLLVLKC